MASVKPSSLLLVLLSCGALLTAGHPYSFGVKGHKGGYEVPAEEAVTNERKTIDDDNGQFYFDLEDDEDHGNYGSGFGSEIDASVPVTARPLEPYQPQTPNPGPRDDEGKGGANKGPKQGGEGASTDGGHAGKKWLTGVFGWLGNTAGKARNSITNAYEGVENGFRSTSTNVKSFFSSFELMVNMGATCVSDKLAVTFDKVKSFDMLARLQALMEKGDESVDEFLQKVGEKVSLWRQQQKGSPDVDEGLFKQDDFDQHFSDSIFEDQDILAELDKMVGKGVFTREEVGQITQTHDAAADAQLPPTALETFKAEEEVITKHDPHHTDKKELDQPAQTYHLPATTKGAPGNAIQFPSKW